MSLHGRIAVVTGASSGIGAAVAEALAEAGASLVLAARRLERLEDLAGRLRARGAIVAPHRTDVTREADVAALFAGVDAQFGRLDLLVNCAGIADHTPTEHLSLSRWREVLDTNLTSAFLCGREALVRMKRQKRGRIIFIGSISAKSPRPDAIAYTATKFALDGMTRSLALDARGDGIAVSILHPGSTVTELVPNMAGRPKADSMSAADVARAVLLMASLPDEVNFLEALMLPLGQPFLGRG